MSRSTYFQRRWPNTPLFQDIARDWCQDHSRLLLDLVWRGYDLALDQDLAAVPISAGDEAKEDSLNHLLAMRIDQCKSGDEPFRVADGPPEHARRKPGKGQPPQPDIGFVWHEDPNCVWPLEAKVLLTETDLKEYLKEIERNFLTGRYAAFSTEGAMLGYLIQGNPEAALDHISRRLGVPMIPHPHFLRRPHRVSDHPYRVEDLSHRAECFLCHHLILVVGEPTR
jgi:hypothetical protein